MRNGDAEVVVLGRWRAGSPERQSSAIDAALAAWDTVGWPPGLQAYTALAAEDGTSVLHLSRWRDDHAARGFTATSKIRWAAAVDEAVPGLDRVGVEAYHHHGGVRFADAEPGCLVLVHIDAADAAAARGWTDAMLTLGREEPPAPGLLAATFHLGVRGTTALTVAEWTDAAAHGAMSGADRGDTSCALVAGTAAVGPVAFTRSSSWRAMTAAPV